MPEGSKRCSGTNDVYLCCFTSLHQIQFSTTHLATAKVKENTNKKSREKNEYNQSDFEKRKTYFRHFTHQIILISFALLKLVCL